MRAVFVDTSGWLALIIQNDRCHETSAKRLCINETYTRLRYDVGLQIAITAKELLEKAEKLNLLHVEWVNKKIAEEAWDFFIKYQDHNLSFTDCTSLSICKRLGTKEAFAFDKHFQLMGMEICATAE